MDGMHNKKKKKGSISTKIKGIWKSVDKDILSTGKAEGSD
jgi:hypothetical protein